MYRVRKLLFVALIGVIISAAAFHAARSRTSAQEAAVQKANRLAKSASPYLRSAAHQPIDWHEWGAEAFERARREDKPILLDIGAVWCHWCHVMDEETYENSEVARLINEHFIAVKVDRDERPDVDRRYQEAVQVITQSGGWPLTAFLTPDGKVFFGGTYFPPEDKDGRVGMRTILTKIAEIYRTQKDRVFTSAKELHEQLDRARTMSATAGELSANVVNTIWTDVVNRYDSQRGGWGPGPKFPNGSAVELALWRAYYDGDKSALEVATKTLREMANGGLRDQLGGGFHRYSVDGDWNVPHFEKMSYVNAELLSAYVHAFQATGISYFRDVAQTIIAYVDREASDRENGGFYATQDADTGKGDDGSYFTWTPQEIAQALTADEAKVVNRFYGVDGGAGRMPETKRVVLRIAHWIEVVANDANLTSDKVRTLLASGKAKLLAARNRRPAPFVDKTKVTAWNGMMISAYAEAYKAFGDEGLKRFAAKSADFLLSQSRQPDGGVYHANLDGKPRVRGMLEDYAYVANGLIDLYQVTAQPRYLKAARELMDYAHERFWDKDKGGFFDIATEPNALAVLQQRHKPIEDNPVASANAIAALALDKLYLLTHEEKYHKWAEETLKAFAGAGNALGTLGSAYALAVAHHLNHPATAVIVGKSDHPRTVGLWRASLGIYRPGKLVSVWDPEITNPPYPPAPDGTPLGYVCQGNTCSQPTRYPDRFAYLLKTFGRAQTTQNVSNTTEGKK